MGDLLTHAGRKRLWEYNHNQQQQKQEREREREARLRVICGRMRETADGPRRIPSSIFTTCLAGCLPAYIYTCIESEKTHVHASCRRGTRRWFRRYNIYSFYEGDGLHYWENLEAAAAAGPIWRHLHHHRARHRVSLFFVCDPYLFKPIF